MSSLSDPIWSAGTEDSTKEEALRLLKDGKWALSATQMGLERKFEFKTFKTTMVCVSWWGEGEGGGYKGAERRNS